MKTRKYITATLLLAAAMMSSCDNFLDDQPRGYAIAEETSHYEGMFNTTDFMNINCEDYTKFLSPQIIITPQNVNGMYMTYPGYKPTSAERAFQFKTDIYEPTENCELWANIYKKIYAFNSIWKSRLRLTPEGGLR